MVYKTLFWHSFISSLPKRWPWIGVRAWGGGCKMQPSVAGWVDSYDLDHEGEFYSASISCSVHGLGFVGYRARAFPVWERSEGETRRQLHLKQSVLHAL